TDTIALTSDDTEDVVTIGNVEGEPTGYTLDQGEAQRLFADESITITGRDEILIGDLAMSFGPVGQNGAAANIGSGGTLEISTADEVTVLGDVALATSSADDTFLIDPTLIAIYSGTGSIRLRNGSGSPLGRIELVGDSVQVGTLETLQRIDNLTGLAAISDLLDQPGGTGDILAAGTIAISVIDSLYIQNSGETDAFAARRGFAAGQIDIDTESTSTQLAINGLVVRNGQPVTGLDAIPLVSINGAPAATGGRFAPLSTINGCVIGTNCAFVPPPAPEPEGPILPDPPSDSDLVQVLPDDTAPPALFVTPIIELADNAPLVQPPLVDEPITGVGNDDLWEPRCTDDSDAACGEADSQP
ncbi:MAG TPA: hypothetical protein VI168_07200, partial [Croceibacterium sp.]